MTTKKTNGSGFDFDIINHISGKPLFTAILETRFSDAATPLKLRAAVEWGIDNGYSLRFAYLRKADLSGLNLKGVDLRKADLSYATLLCSDLTDADLRKAKLVCANVSYSDLTNADFRKSDLEMADLSGCVMKDTRFKGSNTKGATLWEIIDVAEDPEDSGSDE